MSYCDRFLGEVPAFWVELRKRLDVQGTDGVEARRLLNEVVILRGRLDFYESRIKEMNAVAIQEIKL